MNSTFGARERKTHDVKVISDDRESTRHGRSTELEMPRPLLGSLSGSQDESRESMSVDDYHARRIQVQSSRFSSKRVETETKPRTHASSPNSPSNAASPPE